MAVHIITDSASDLSSNAHPRLTVLPLSVAFGDTVYRDGVDLDNNRFYEMLVESDHLPTTGQVNPFAFSQAIGEVRDADPDAGIVIVTLSSKLSGTNQSACIAALEADGEGAGVYVVDSLNATVGERVRLLAGLPVSVFDRVYERVSFTPGARELVAAAHARGWTVGVVSGGFHEIADRLQTDAGIDLCLANRLEQQGGKLVGRTLGPVVTRELKLQTVEAWAERVGCGLPGTIAVGDGANDIPMICAAGIGIAFCAKPAVREAAPFHIDERNLLRVLDIVDAHPLA